MKATVLIAVSSALSFAVIAAEPQKRPRSGEQIYREYCFSCHSAGWQGAPLANDKRDWEERIAKGAEVLLANSRQGLNGMPPLGTCMDCSDAELQAAIGEMLKF